jgi:tRNA(Ile)-lysidine synthase
MRAVNGLLHHVTRTIERYRMFGAGAQVGVAVSGGADSVCLLHVLAELAAGWGLQLKVLHVNHQLRGSESQADAEFVEKMACRLGLPLILREVNVAAAVDNLEQAARVARMSVFREAIESGAVDVIAVGHTRSDQAETVLFRFLRGSGTAGLSGIRPVIAPGIVRPLIEVERSDVEQFLRERGIAWREDSSNASPAFARNRIRHQLLPQLAREWNPEIGDTLAHVAEWAQGEEAYWKTEVERLAAEHLEEREGAVILRADVLRDMPVAVARRLVRYALERVKGDLRGIDFRHIESVLHLAELRQRAGGCQAPEVSIRRSFEWIRFQSGRHDLRRPDYRISVLAPQVVRIPGTSTAISLELIEKAETSGLLQCVYNGEMGCLDWGRLSGSLELRNWQAGDQYQPVGSTAPEKIKLLFHQARIPLWDRKLWPVLTSGASIVWALRFGPAAEVAAAGESRTILRIRELGSV